MGGVWHIVFGADLIDIGVTLSCLAISVYVGKNVCLKKCPKNFQMPEQYWGCLDKLSEVNFSPA